WDYHVKQRGNSDKEIEERKKAVEQIYAAPGLGAADSLLRRYHVGYVYVGWLEKKTYPAAGLKKFDSAKGLLEPAYENRESKIYRVVGGETEDVFSVMREALPETPKTAEAPGDEPEESPSISDSASADRPAYFGMREPRDGAVDGKGRLWVADFGKNRIRIFDPNGGFLGGWGGRGNGNYGLREPCGVAIQGEDVYVADTWNGRAELFSLAGEWKASAAGFYGPRGIAASSNGDVWVTDSGNNQLVRLDKGLADRKIVGKKGSGPAEFLGPVGIAVGPSGSVYVADVGNRRIQVLDSQGSFSSSISFPGWADWCEAHLEADRDESLYVSDPLKNNVLHLDPKGAVLQTWTASSEGQPFSRPTGIAIDGARGILYVINAGTNSVARTPPPERKTR